ncbi:MAG: hypothetical protein ACTSXY_04350 [Promethearchaeota archaeon]
MVKKKEMLDEMGYEEEVKKPKEEPKIKTRISRNNPSVNKNSQLGGDF